VQNQLAIEAKKLSKVYADLRALDDLTLDVPVGSIFGLLGPNGAGKTTLLRTLMGYIRPTCGIAKVMGHSAELDCLAVRKVTSYLPAEAKLFRLMRGDDVIELFSKLHPKGNFKLAKAICERLALDTRRRVGFMSTGMRQKLAIACVLGIESDVVILDEPTANLDPSVRSEVLSLVREARQRGSTIVFSSHLLDEIELLCNQATVIKQGRVVREIDLGSLRQTYRIVIEGQFTPHDVPVGLELEAASTYRLQTEQLSLDDALSYFRSKQAAINHIEPIGLRTVYESCF
jgi:ABC-2 type transport system ATP-binding protein